MLRFRKECRTSGLVLSRGDEGEQRQEYHTGLKKMDGTVIKLWMTAEKWVRGGTRSLILTWVEAAHWIHKWKC